MANALGLNSAPYSDISGSTTIGGLKYVLVWDTTNSVLRFFDGSTASGQKVQMTGAPANVSGSFAITPASNSYRVDTSGGAATATLPSSPQDGDRYTVKDATGHAGTHAITISGSVNIDGSASLVLSTNYGRATLEFNANTNQWGQIA